MLDSSYDRLLEAALSLAPNFRAMLAERLLSSLDDASQAEIDAAWGEVAESRWRDIQQGRVEPIPGENVMAALRDRPRR